ncbi:MAG: hypothetical protein M0005_16985 [Actinomycetota bacterium]|nr:hypothetical protein [Actinomycetota bacterium]
MGGQPVVPVDMARLTATVRFDLAAQLAEVSAVVDLTLEQHAGWPAFDLRQDIDSASFDGTEVPGEALEHRDMGAGYEARMRCVEVACDPGSRHRLELRYRLGTPQATGAQALEWPDQGVRWDLWMSDLEPGRYLEMWLPANLCHDRLAIELSVEVAGAGRRHVLLANGEINEAVPGRRWSVRYPPSYTALSPLLVLAPAEEVVLRRRETSVAGLPMSVTVACLAGAGAAADPASADSAAADVTAWLSYFAARYGRWAHSSRFVAVVWGSDRGMEYDGATTSSPHALEHEVFHSWFGRGVKPARASDGWIDEAMATWATASRRAVGRYGAEELGLDEPPTLLCPPHPWSRHTPREAYLGGSRLLAGLAYMAGGAPQLRSALADWYGTYRGRAASSEDLANHMARWCGRDVGPWFDRYVHGRG